MKHQEAVQAGSKSMFNYKPGQADAHPLLLQDKLSSSSFLCRKIWYSLTPSPERVGAASIGLIGYGKENHHVHLLLTLLLLLYLPDLKLHLLILLLQAEAAVEAAGRHRLPGKTVPEAPPNCGAQLA